MREKAARLIGGLAGALGLAAILIPLGFPIGANCECLPFWWLCLWYRCDFDLLARAFLIVR